MNWALLQNSLLVSGLTTLLSVGIGMLGALWLAGIEPKWRGRILPLAVIALVLPPFLVTNCWLDLLGENGLLHRWLPINIYSVSGTVWILTLLTWPITLLAALAAWHRLEGSQLESDPALSGVALIRWLLWPMAQGLVGLAAVLTFVLSLNNFAVPTILQVKVFPAEAWLRYYSQFDLRGTLAVSWPLVVAPLLLIIVSQRAEINWPHERGKLPHRALRRQLGTQGFYFSGGVLFAMLALSVGIPLAQLLGGARTWTEMPAVVRVVAGTAWNSFSLAVLAASVCVAVGLATWRVRVGLWLWLPLLIPGILLSIGLILIFDRAWLETVYQSAAIVVIAWSCRYAAIAWHGTARALQGMDRDLTDAARLCGAGRWALLRYVHWPQIAPQVAAAWYVTYLLCLWDIETLILIVPPGRETLALRIFNLLHYGHHAQVNALCLLLLGLALAPIALIGLSRMLLSRRKVDS